MSNAMGGNDRPFAVGYIFSGKHAHANGHRWMLSEVESIHLCRDRGC